MKDSILIASGGSCRVAPTISPAMTLIKYEDDVRYRILQSDEWVEKPNARDVQMRPIIQ